MEKTTAIKMLVEHELKNITDNHSVKEQLFIYSRFFKKILTEGCGNGGFENKNESELFTELEERDILDKYFDEIKNSNTNDNIYALYDFDEGPKKNKSREVSCKITKIINDIGSIPDTAQIISIANKIQEFQKEIVGVGDTATDEQITDAFQNRLEKIQKGTSLEIETIVDDFYAKLHC